VEFEAVAGALDRPYSMPVGDDLVLDPRPAISALARDARAGVDVGLMSARFHAAVADATCEAILRTGLGLAVLSGGVFQNRILLTSVQSGLEAAGVRVLIPRRVPPNDGGIAYGQAAVATARTR
jgi:hydrogenase maturation protein HypF